MSLRRALTVAGAGLSTAIVVAAAVTELLSGHVEFSTLVGLPAGLLAGATVAVGILVTLDRIDSASGAVLGGYAAFGYAVLGCLALRYADVGGAREVLDLRGLVGLSIVAGVVVLVGLLVLDRRVT